MVKLNYALAEELGLEATRLESAVGAAVFAGNHVPAWADPLAMAYAGHQFGHFVPQLGDGRAILLGEIISRRWHAARSATERRGPDPLFAPRRWAGSPRPRAPRIYHQRGDACPGHSDDARAGDSHHG